MRRLILSLAVLTTCAGPAFADPGDFFHTMVTIFLKDGQQSSPIFYDNVPKQYKWISLEQVSIFCSLTNASPSDQIVVQIGEEATDDNFLIPLQYQGVEKGLGRSVFIANFRPFFRLRSGVKYLAFATSLRGEGLGRCNVKLFGEYGPLARDASPQQVSPK